MSGLLSVSLWEAGCLCENAFVTGAPTSKSENTPALPPSPVKIHFGREGLDHSSWDRSKYVWCRCRGWSTHRKLIVSQTALSFWSLDSVFGKSKGSDFLCSNNTWTSCLRVTGTCPQGNIPKEACLFLLKRVVILERSGYWGYLKREQKWGAACRILWV